MLYDPKWETKTKPDIYAIETMIAWLEKHPAEKTYKFIDCQGGCLIDQYLKAHNPEWTNDLYVPFVHKTKWDFDVAYYAGQHTFGAALKRARKLASK